MIQRDRRGARIRSRVCKAIAAERDGDRIYLRARPMPGTIAQIMGALNAAGFNNIGLVTDIGGPTLMQGAR
jgi:biopolymer transport protein TolR